MGSGKSTVGKLLADKTSRDFVDVDKLIEEREKMKIKDIFEKKGELYFRELEKKYLQELLNTQNLVVSTGGGLGADAENMNQMKKKRYSYMVRFES